MSQFYIQHNSYLQTEFDSASSSFSCKFLMNYGSKSCNIVYGLQAGREPIFLRLSLSLIVLMLILLVIFITTTVILVRYKTRIQRKPDQLVRESTREETTTYEDINLTQLGGIDTSENIAYGHLSSRHV